MVQPLGTAVSVSVAKSSASRFAAQAYCGAETIANVAKPRTAIHACAWERGLKMEGEMAMENMSRMFKSRICPEAGQGNGSPAGQAF